MNKLERVQVGIRACLKPMAKSSCGECPYRDGKGLCTEAMNREALELVTMMATAWDMVTKTLADYHLSLEDAGKKKRAKLLSRSWNICSSWLMTGKRAFRGFRRRKGDTMAHLILPVVRKEGEVGCD